MSCRELADYLGHEQVSTTEGTYVHLFERDKDDAARQTMDAAMTFGGPAG